MAEMRITGGTLRGRRLRVPAGRDVRPTQDRVREALFSILGERVCGARFLDIFAGSGAVGLEAFSRGASSVCCVESGRRALSVLRDNVRELGGSAVQVRGCEGVLFLKKGLAGEPFDIIFCDPPYRSVSPVGEARGRARRPPDMGAVLAAVSEGGALADGGVFVMEQGSDEGVPPHEGWSMLKEKAYGRARLCFLAAAGD